MNLQYIADHWAHISTGVLTTAIFCIAHGGIKGIALAIWSGKAKTTETTKTTQP